MTDLYLIRHAQAEGNLYRRIHGHYNSLLTDLGERQVQALEMRFADLPVDAVYSSDLTRAAATAAAVSRPKGLPIHRTEALREVALGAWEDRMWGEIEEEQAEQYAFYNACPDRWHIPGSERWEHLKTRMTDAVLSIAEENPGRTVAVASHGCAIRALTSAVLGVPAEKISTVPYCDNTAVTLLHIEGRHIELAYMNDSSHLPDELSAFRHETWWKNKSGTDGRNMRIDPFDVAANREAYLRRYREAWVLSHGSERGFSDIYYDWAVLRSMADARTVCQATLAGQPTGMIELATASGADEGCGHIAFLCMDEPFRGQGLAVQLIGHAVSYYRALGRKKLRLNVNEANRRAVQFYKRYGFVPVRREKGAVGHIYVMEKGIALP